MRGYIRAHGDGTGTLHFHDGCEAKATCMAAPGWYRCTAQYGTDGWSVDLGKMVDPREEVSRLKEMATAGNAQAKRHRGMATKLNTAVQLEED